MGAITANKIAAGSIGVSQIANNTVQAPIAACASGLAAYGVENSQFFLCDVGTQLTENAITGLGDIETAIAVRSSGIPMILHAATGGLRLARCLDRACTRSVITTPVAQTVTSPRIVLLANDVPVLVYRQVGVDRLRIYVCDDANCSTGTVRDPLPSVVAEGFFDLLLQAGNPTVFFQGDNQLMQYRCADTACSSGTSSVLSSTSGGGFFISAQLRNDGRAVLAHQNDATSDLLLYDCSDTTCSTGTVRVLDTAGTVGNNASLRISSNNLPVIAYQDNTNFDLKLYRCSDSSCSTGNASVLVDTTAGLGAPNLAFNHDIPNVLYHLTAPNPVGRHIYRCADSACSSGSSELLQSASRISLGRATIRSDGRLLQAYRRDSVVRMMICHAADCR
jgi:hypothetical protein